MNILNILLWILQILAALVYVSSGVMKVFMFDKIKEEVHSFDALSRSSWKALGILELLCAIGLVAPPAFNLHTQLTVIAAVLLAIESLVFIWVHVKYRETSAIIMSALLGLFMVFIAFGRSFF